MGDFPFSLSPIKKTAHLRGRFLIDELRLVMSWLPPLRLQPFSTFN
jgi:hypothetical protein